MHEYSINSPERKLVPIVLAFVSVFISWGLNSLAIRFSINLPWFVSVPSVMGVYGLLYLLYSQFFWKVKLFSKTPCLSGTWIGIGESIHSENGDGEKTLFYPIIHIRQSWQKISVVLYTVGSKSTSSMASMRTIDTQDAGLKYEYLNEPLGFTKNTMAPHRGVHHLSFSTDYKILSGDYYTNKHRGNYGHIEVSKHSDEIIDRKNLKSEIENLKNTQ